MIAVCNANEIEPVCINIPLLEEGIELKEERFYDLFQEKGFYLLDIGDKFDTLEKDKLTSWRNG